MFAHVNAIKQLIYNSYHSITCLQGIFWSTFPDTYQTDKSHMSPIYRKSTLARLPSEESAVVCLGFAQTEVQNFLTRLDQRSLR